MSRSDGGDVPPEEKRPFTGPERRGVSKANKRTSQPAAELSEAGTLAPDKQPEPLHREEVGATTVPTRTPASKPSVASEAIAPAAAEHAAVSAIIPELAGTATHLPPAPPAVPAITTRGWLVAIGGRMEDAAIIDRFVQLCGGDAANILVIPTASNEGETGAWYQALFERHGARASDILRLQRRGDRVTPEQLKMVADATGVFFTGGNQLKLATFIIGTPLAEAIRARYAKGMPVAGTSAGASFLSAHMIAFGQEGGVPHAAMVTTCGGLGLTERFIVDQHFRERSRLGRLLTAVAYNPFVVGLGVDENTAVFISPDDVVDAVGEGVVTIVDPAELDTTHILEALPGTALELPGMRVCMLQPGESLELTSVY